MRRLIILRHAKTERAAPGERDRDRKLMKRGRADAPTMGAYMASHGILPDLALVSPARRAQETWELIAPAFAAKARTEIGDHIYNATVGTLLDVVRGVRGARTVLLVGHNPGLHDLAMLLVATGDVTAREKLKEKLPTSGLAVIDLPVDAWARLAPQSGRLERFVSPRTIAATIE